MNPFAFSRRSAILGALGTAVAWPAAAARGAVPGLDLDDPAERGRIIASVVGSTAEDTLYKFYRLHIYAYHHQGNIEPWMTMTNLNISKWRPLANGNYDVRVYESGAYTRFDSTELLESWTNPVTGELIEVLPFLGGPLKAEYGPNGLVLPPEREASTKLLNIEVFGDTVMLATEMNLSHRNPFQPDEWPEKSSGEIMYWDSHYVHFASLRELSDRSRPSVHAHTQFQNLVSWQPWHNMGQRPGRTWGRAYGAKIDGFDQIPPAYRANLEAQTPEIFDIDNWEEPRDEVREYKDEMENERQE